MTPGPRNKLPLCALVDAFGPGQFFTGALKKRGFGIVHVLSSPDVPAAFKRGASREEFARTIVHRGSLEETAAALKGMDLRLLIAGAETGVLLADSLCDVLSLSGNGIRRSTARRDKYAMVQAMTDHGTPAARSMKTSDRGAALRWIESIGGCPVVLKPLRSAGSDGVFICRSPAEAETAFSRIIGTKDLFGAENIEVLVQEFLHGTEYAINSVSLDGRHYATDIWRYHKTLVGGQRPIYDYDELIPSSGRLAKRLLGFLPRVLDALEIDIGAAHTEIMDTAHGLVLVECGARLGGGVIPDCHDVSLGHNQMDLTLDAYLDPEAFSRRTATAYEIREHMLLVNASTDKEGVIVDIPLMERAKTVKSVKNARFNRKIGDRLTRTVDISTSPAVFMLSNLDKAALELDHRALVGLFKDGFDVAE